MGVHAECPSCARLVPVACPSVLLPPCCASPHLASPARSGFVARLLLRRCGGVPPFRYRPFGGLRTAAHFSPRRRGGQPRSRLSLGGFGASPRNTLPLPRPLPRRLRRLPPPLRSLCSLPVGGSVSLLVRSDHCPSCARFVFACRGHYACPLAAGRSPAVFFIVALRLCSLRNVVRSASFRVVQKES